MAEMGKAKTYYSAFGVLIPSAIAVNFRVLDSIGRVGNGIGVGITLNNFRWYDGYWKSMSNRFNSNKWVNLLNVTGLPY